MTAEERAALKLNIDEAKFLEAVDREGDHEVGAGKLAAHTDDKRAHSPFTNSENASRAALVERVAKVIALAYDYGGDERLLEMAFHSKVSRKRYHAQAEAAIDLIRAEVLEEAALRAEDFLGEAWAHEIAAAIRALKEKI